MGDAQDRHFHLTPSGWIESASPPADRVVTYELSEYQESPSAPVEKSGGVVWTHSDTARVAALQAKFGAKPF